MIERPECGAWTMYAPADMDDDHYVELKCNLPEGHIPRDVHEDHGSKWKESEYTTIPREE